MRVFFVGALVLVLGALVSWGVFFALNTLFGTQDVPEEVLTPILPVDEPDTQVIEVRPIGPPVYIPDTYNVTFNEGISLEEAERIIADVGGTVLNKISLPDFLMLRIQAEATAYEALRVRVEVRSVNKDSYLEAQSGPLFESNTWHSFLPTSAHAAVPTDLHIIDAGGHGTAVLSVARNTLSAIDGSSVRVQPFSVSSRITEEGRVAIALGDTAIAIRQSVADGAEVISLSFEEACELSDGRVASCGKHPDLANAFNYARSQGVLIVKAAGNSPNIVSAWIGDPAVLLVGGLEKLLYPPSDVLWCVNSHTYFGGTSATRVDLYASGEVAFGGSSEQGTSFATPRIAAYAATLVSNGMNTSKSAVMNALQSEERDTWSKDHPEVVVSGHTLFGEGRRLVFDDESTPDTEYVTCVSPAATPTPEQDTTPSPDVSAGPEEAPAEIPASVSTNSACPQNFNLLPDDACTLEGFFAILLDAVVNIGAILLVLALVWTGFLFVQAQGNEEKIRNARSALMWAVLGGLLLLGAQALSMVIKATIETL